MDKNDSTRWSPSAYALAALALGLLWYAAFLVRPGWRASETARVQEVPFFVVPVLLVAWSFRRKIMTSHGFASDLCLAIALPSVGITVVSTALLIGSATVGGRPDDIALLFVYPLMGMYVVFTSTWYIVVPMGLLSQFVMKAVARRVWQQGPSNAPLQSTKQVIQ